MSSRINGYSPRADRARAEADFRRAAPAPTGTAGRRGGQLAIGELVRQQAIRPIN
jgi:hypothetical protein